VPKSSETPHADDDVMMTTDEVRVFLRLKNPRTVYRMHKDGRLVGSRTGGDGSPLRFRRVDVEAFLERQKGK